MCPWGFGRLARHGTRSVGLAVLIKNDLEAAAFKNAPVRGATSLTVACQGLIGLAEHLGTGH